MKQAQLKLKKSIKANVVAASGNIKIRFPKQTLGPIAITFTKKDGSTIILKQYELILQGDSLVCRTVK